MRPEQIQLYRWRHDAVQFVRDNFHTEPDKWQHRALMAYCNNDQRVLRLSLQACAGPGKTAVLAWIGWHFISCFGDENEHPKGAAVAVTKDNLDDNLWPEFSKWQQRSPYLLAAFVWTQSAIYAKDHPDTWFISARSWAKTASTEELGKTLSGLHSQYVLILIDESGEIPVEILKTGDQALGNCTFGRMIQAGNPTSQNGMLYAAATRLRELWTVIIITGDPDDHERSPRVDIEWARQQIKLYGRDDPWVASLILGKFPESGINTLLTIDEVEAAMKRRLRPDMYDFSQKRLGVDVARFGMDSTIIFPRQGLRAFNYVLMRKASNPQVAARVAVAKDKWQSEREYVDGSGGYGAGVVDALNQAGYTPAEVYGASTNPPNPRFYNLRAYMLWECAQWVKRGGALPYDQTLIKEMTAPTYSFKGGKLIVEEKDQIKKRLGFSPDRFDALALTFSEPDMPAMRNQVVVQGSQPYDPFKQQNQVAVPAADDRAYFGGLSNNNSGSYDPFNRR